MVMLVVINIMLLILSILKAVQLLFCFVKVCEPIDKPFAGQQMK